MNKKKLLFITHYYHAKTKSCDFLLDYLKMFFDVTSLYDDSRQETTRVDYAKSINSENYDAVLFWQILPTDEQFEEFEHKNMLYAPMYDFSMNWTFADWYKYKNIKFINFSKALHSRLSKWGFDSLFVQYFIKPEGKHSGATDEAFLWQRVTDINFKTVKKILPYNNLKLHIHRDLDPYQEFMQPNEADEKKYGITYSKWFDDKKDLISLIQKKGIYIAPRMQEGIGMSFLEAMAMGKAVIANNEPTMNEYIEHGVTGYLVDFRNPKRINLSNIAKIQANTYEYAQNGYQNWLLDREKIIGFINKPTADCNINDFTKYFETKIKMKVIKKINKIKKIKMKFEKFMSKFKEA